LGAVLTTLDYSGVEARYFVPTTTGSSASVNLCAVGWGDCLSNRSHDQPPRWLRHVDIVLLTMAVAVDVCVVMRAWGIRGRERDRWLMVACQTKYRHRPSCKFLPP